MSVAQQEMRLKYSASTAAAFRMSVVIRLEALHFIGAARATQARTTHLLFLVVSANLPHQIAKCFVDIDPLFSRRLDETAAKMLRQFSSLVAAHLSFIFQIALVCHNDYGKRVLVFDPQDLLVECENLVETIARRDAVHQQESLACPHVLLPHGAVCR